MLTFTREVLVGNVRNLQGMIELFDIYTYGMLKDTYDTGYFFFTAASNVLEILKRIQ